jgi:hypothetical protein
MWIWLIAAVFAGALTVERLNAMLGSATTFPGISVVGIVEVLLPAEATGLLLIRWQDARRHQRRSWGWLLLAAFGWFMVFLIVGTALLASRPGGLAPSGLLVVLVIGTLAAFASWRSMRRRPTT